MRHSGAPRGAAGMTGDGRPGRPPVAGRRAMSSLPLQESRPAPAPHQVADLGEGRGPLWLDAFLAVRMPEILTWRRHLHAHPEISNAEFATTAYLRRQLGRSGVDSRILPAGTGLVCDVGPAGPGERTVALRADIDALPLPEASGLPFASTVPGVSHACGHDVHQTVLLGAMLALQLRAGAAGPDPGDFPAGRGDPARRRLRRRGQRRGRRRRADLRPALRPAAAGRGGGIREWGRSPRRSTWSRSRSTAPAGTPPGRT